MTIKAGIRVEKVGICDNGLGTRRPLRQVEGRKKSHELSWKEETDDLEKKQKKRKTCVLQQYRSTQCRSNPNGTHTLSQANAGHESLEARSNLLDNAL